MLGKRSPQRELFRPDNALLAHVGEDSYFAFLAREGSTLFRDADFADLYGERGRPSVPPSQLCVLLVLQAREGLSDQEAIDRTAYDLRFKVALGVELEEKLCAKSTLQLFRANLLLNERFLALFEASVAACRRAGLGSAKKLEVAIDSTPIFGRGAVKDTVNLVSDAIVKVVTEACRLKGWGLDEVVREQGLTRHFGSSFKGESELDWSDESERRALVGQLVADARLTLALGRRALCGYAKDATATAELRASRELLVRILAQDVDEDPEEGGGPRIKRGTAKDRVISTTDQEMRHGHKSHSKGFDGYKASLVVETKDGVILATGVRAANAPDREGAAELVERASKVAKSKVERVLGDTAYGDLGTRAEMAALGAEVVAKAPPIPTKGKCFARDRFVVNEKRGEAHCPAGKRSRYRRRADDGWTYVFSRLDCRGCALRSQCTTSKTAARSVTVTAGSKELDRHRKHQKTKAFRKRYRKRVAVEHAIGRLVGLGVRQARYFGRAKTALQIALAATAANLRLAAVCSDLRHVAAALLRSWWVVALTTVLRQPCGRRVREMALCRPGL